MRTKQILPLFALLLLFSGTLAAAECEDTSIFLHQVTDPATKAVTLTAYVDANFTQGAIHEVPDAKLDFLNKAGDVLCSGVVSEKTTDSSGVEHYAYTCKLSYDKIKGTCSPISAKMIGPAKYCQAEAATTVCDYSSSAFTFISNTFSESFSKTAKENYGACLVAFIMLGVLLATMFYSGKSPMSLLNITTPNLPSPKSTAASGQVLGHMVYGRMKKMYVDQLGKIGKIMETHSNDLEKNIRAKGTGASVSAVNALFSNMRGDPQTRALLKYLALSMAENGSSINDIKAVVRGKSLFAYSKEEHTRMAQEIQKLKRADKKSAQFSGNLMDKYVLNYVALNKMNVLTGESGENRGAMDLLYRFARMPVDGIGAIYHAPYIGGKAWMKKVMDEEKHPVVSRVASFGLGKFPIIGGFIGTSIDSLFRSIRMTGRYGQVVGGSIARGIGRKTGALDSTKIRTMGEALDKERVGEQQMSYLKRMTYKTLTAGAPETTKAGGMYPIFLKVKELYETVYKECHYDAMGYMLKQLYRKYGVTFDFSEAEVAKFMYKDMDVLAMSKLKGNASLKEIHEADEQVRKILTAKKEDFAGDAKLQKLLAAKATMSDFAFESELLEWKVGALRNLVKGRGGYVDPQMEDYLGQVHTINNVESDEPHVKFLRLKNYLETTHHTDAVAHNPYDLADPNRFYTRVGRNSLTYYVDGKEVHSDRFSQLALRTMMFSAEKDSLHGGIEDVLKSMWVYLVNRARSLNPKDGLDATPEMKEETTKIGKRINAYMGELLTDEGHKAAQKYSLKHDPNDYKTLLTGEEQMKEKLGAKGREIYVEFGDYGRAGIIRSTIEKMISRGMLPPDTLDNLDNSIFMKAIRMAFPAFFKGGIPAAYYKKDGMPVFWDDDASILGPSKTWWKVDMKKDWQTSGESERIIQYYVDGIFGKGYKMPYKASIYKEFIDEHGMLHDPEGKVKSCNQYAITKEFAEKVLKPAFAKNALFNEMDGFLNGVMAMNAYKHFNETSRFYLKMMQGMLVGAVVNRMKSQMDEEKSAANIRRIGVDIDAAITEIEALDFTKPKDMNKFIELLKANKDSLRSFMEKPFTYDLLERSPHAWVFLHEGGFAPFVRGMPLSDFDRPIGGFVALKDESGKWRRYDPQNVDIKFGTDPESLHLRNWYADLQNHGERDSVKWAGFLDDAAKWAKGNYERQKQFNAVLWRYAQSTEDWHEFWNRSEMTIRPKHEVLGARVSILPYPSADDLSFGVMEPLRKLREWGRGAGLWMERSSLYSAGNVYSSSYELVAASKFAALQLADYARDIRLSSADEMGVSPEVYDQLSKLADHITSKLLMTQEFGIDRHPGRHSTSHGLQNALASSFHYGPAAAYDPRFYKAFFTKSEYYPYAMATGIAQVARYLAFPAITAFRGFQMSLFGYPNKWNYQESAMTPFAYRFPDILGAFRSIANPFYSSLNWFSGAGFGTRLGPEGDMIARDTGGPKFRRGMRPLPEEMEWIGKGTQYWARIGVANPGETRLNPRMVPQIAGPMSEYLAHRDQFAGYYSQMPDIQKSAYTTYVKREVSAAALLTRREEELRGYAPFSNAIWGWTSPLMFAWHLPGLPISPRDIYMHYKEGKRRMGWEQMSMTQKASQVISGGGGGMLGAAVAQLKPWYTDEEGNVKLYGMGGRFGQGTTRSLITCPTCNAVIQRWGGCPNCSSTSRRRGP